MFQISEDNIAVLLKISIFCDVTAWSLTCVFRRFEANNVFFMFKKLSLKMKRYDISKRRSDNTIPFYRIL